MGKSQILYAIKEIDMLIIREILKNTKNGNCTPVTPIQGRIINYLFEMEDEGKIVFQRDLEKVLGIRRSTISGVLQTMEKNDIIKRVAVREDARVKRIVLTDKAMRENIMIKEKFNEIDDIISKNIAIDDLEVFMKVTQQIKKNLQEGND